MNEMKINFYPVITKKVERKEQEFPYAASVKVSGVKDELYCFLQWLIAYCISHCARKYGDIIYRIELDTPLDGKDIPPLIQEHYNDIIEYDINEIFLKFASPSQDPSLQWILDDLKYKLLQRPFEALKRNFYNIQKGCKTYAIQKDNTQIMEIFSNPDRWYEFRNLGTIYNQYD